jgi:hypothetical protein
MTTYSTSDVLDDEVSVRLPARPPTAAELRKQKRDGGRFSAYLKMRGRDPEALLYTDEHIRLNMIPAWQDPATPAGTRAYIEAELWSQGLVPDEAGGWRKVTPEDTARFEAEFVAAYGRADPYFKRWLPLDRKRQAALLPGNLGRWSDGPEEGDDNG